MWSPFVQAMCKGVTPFLFIYEWASNDDVTFNKLPAYRIVGGRHLQKCYCKLEQLHRRLGGFRAFQKKILPNKKSSSERCSSWWTGDSHSNQEISDHVDHGSAWFIFT